MEIDLALSFRLAICFVIPSEELIDCDLCENHVSLSYFENGYYQCPRLYKRFEDELQPS